MSAESLEGMLRARGIRCRVEGHERLALLVPDGPVVALEELGVRREVVSLLRDHGFTHIALELDDDPGADAAVHRD